MDDLLFLSHRIPFPPEKGDKIRSFHILEHLASRYRVHLGCFYDDPTDARHIDELRRRCGTVLCLPLHRTRAWIGSLTALATGYSLTETYFHDARLARWVAETMRQHRPGRSFIFCSAMAPYALPYRQGTRIFDMMDIDSEKWGAYADVRPWPLSQLYARERRLLFELERRAAAEFDRTLLVSRAEAELFQRLAPEVADRVHALRNGVDTTYFDPRLTYSRPFADAAVPIVFAGTMDYWPNIQAAEWFAGTVLPLLGGCDRSLEFWIVGANPAPAIRRLAERPGIHVTGRVEDMRPYLVHAAAIVAPLRVARGIQNKVLEAMAMAKPVVATPEAAEGILGDAKDEGRDELIVRTDAAGFAQGLAWALTEEGAGIGQRARRLVERHFQWRESWVVLDALFAAGQAQVPAAGRVAPETPASALG
jgi:sugar transferase (PEP-CTERM/EpsH1 system associated)